MRFPKAKKFIRFDQSEHLGSEGKVTSIDFNSKRVSEMVSYDGACFGYCCAWIKNMKLNRNYLVRNDTFDALIAQTSMEESFKWSKTLNILQLQLGVTPKDLGSVSDFLNGMVGGKHLNKYAENAHFLMLYLKGKREDVKAKKEKEWAHAISLKLDRSKTGGWLNWSYPCALFDPNFGQGMYSGNGDLADDLWSLIQAYDHSGYPSSVVTEVQVISILFPGGID